MTTEPSGSGSPDSRLEDEYIDAPTEAHIDASREAMETLCAVLNAEAAAHPSSLRQRVLRVRLCHFRQNHLLTQRLFTFAVASAEGTQRSLADPGEVSYAVVINCAVETQLRSVIAVTAELALRQDLMARIRQSDSSIGNIDEQTAASDRQAKLIIADSSSNGWRSAASVLVRAAADRGYTLDCRYEADVLPTRQQVTERIPRLRRAYNTRPELRDLIDKAVAAARSSQLRVSGPRGPEALRGLIQQTATAMSLDKHVNHTFRDAFALGNGYMVVDVHQSPPVYNLEPSAVTLEPEGQYRVTHSDGSERVLTDGVVHLRGVEQLVSPYGISTLEAFLTQLDQKESIDHGAEAAKKMLSGTSAATGREAISAREWATEVLALQQRAEASSAASIRQVIAQFVTDMPAPPPDLYFTGYADL